MKRVRALHVSTTQGPAGTLAKDGTHVFSYDAATLAHEHDERAVSLTMPLRAAPWQSVPMLPAFQTFLPEGFLRERVHERFGKTMRMDDMAMLMLTGGDAIGRLRVSAAPRGHSGDEGAAVATPSPVESLAEILSDQGSRDLFEYLCDRYLIASGVAGVQPKVLVDAVDDAPDVAPRSMPASQMRQGSKPSLDERSTLRARRLIVKASGPDWPGLAANEFHCLSIARAASMEVPRFSRSADHRRLAVERFDVDPVSGHYLGFEDMVSLLGRVNERKYEGSYESVAKAVRVNASPLHLHVSLRALFQVVALSVVLRNGDAHLKNFGMLYSDPMSEDCRLSPVYDLVCTTVFLPPDRLALKLAGRRDWPDRATLAAFGREHCDVDDAEREIDRLVGVAMEHAPSEGPDEMWTAMREHIVQAASSLSR